VVVALLALSIRYFWPLPAQLGSMVPGDQRDPLLNAALLDHVFRSIATLQWGQVWQAPIFHPHTSSLAFSESFLGSAWYGVPLWLLTPNPIALHNAFGIAGLFFSALAACVLGWCLTRSLVAGLVCGVIYAFGPFHLVHSMHVQMHQAYGAPLVFLGLWWTVRGPFRRHLGWIGCAAALALQVLSCSYLGLFTAALSIPALILVARLRGLSGLRDDGKSIAAGALVAAALLAIPMLHYVEIAQELGFKRNLDEIRSLSARPDSWKITPHSLMFPSSVGRQSSHPEESSWPGRAGPLLGLGGLVLLLVQAIRRRKLSDDLVVSMLAVGTAGWSFWLSTGPGPYQPYSLLLNYVPGFTGLRVPSRFYGLTLLMVGVAACVLVGLLVKRWPRGGQVAGVLIAAVCALDVWPRSYPSFPLPDGGDMGPLLTALRDDGKNGPILEIPYRLYWRSSQHDLNTTRHHRRTANGYSGVEPPLALALRYLLPSFPLSGTDALVRQLGVEALVLHRGPPRADPGERAPFLEEALRDGQQMQGFAVRMNQAAGALLDVTQDAPGPQQTLNALWTREVRACAAPSNTRRGARVTMPLHHALVSPNVRHQINVVGGGRATMSVPAVGMIDTFVGAVELPADALKITLAGSEVEVPVEVSSPSSLSGVRLSANLPQQLRSGQGVWLRIQVDVDGGSIPAALGDGSVKGHDLRLTLLGVPGEIRPTVLPLRTDAAAGCPGIAEGAFEFLKGAGAAALRIQLVPSGGGAALAETTLPIQLDP